MVTWRDRDHDHIRVQHIDRGQARGSFSIRGPNEFAMLEFDRRKQLAAGVRRDTAEAQITGRVSAELSAEVNRVLERADQNGQLWYCPVDYGDFVLFYERQWRDGMKPQ
jgi:hypothetical protein